MGYQPAPDRWVDRHPLLTRLLANLTMGALAGVAAGALVLQAESAGEREYVAIPPSVPSADPELVRNGTHCEKGLEIFDDLAGVVADADSLRADAVLSEVHDAESRMARRADVPSDRLTETFRAARVSLRDLRIAIAGGDEVGPALDTTLDLMDTLDEQCRQVLLPG